MRQRVGYDETARREEPMKTLQVHVLPELVGRDELSDRTVVVIDVLRATTTICAALAAGARAVIPCLTVDDAWRRAEQLPAGNAVLAGERRGLPIEGFGLDNSPGEFTPESVGGKTVILTTTNGTRALLHARAARRIVVGALANLSAVCSTLDNADVDVHCAGTDGQASDEDMLVAGAIVERLATGGAWTLSTDAEEARKRWREVSGGDGRDFQQAVVEALRASRGGQNLIAIGMARDIEWAARIDRFAIVPRFDPAAGEITLVP
jgi:2-phosphosulfolactate phosphatase